MIQNQRPRQQRGVAQAQARHAPPGSSRGQTQRNQTRWQEGLCQRLNDPRNPRQRVGPISILSERPTTNSFQAMYCLGNGYSVIHPFAVRDLGLIPQPLPPNQVSQGFLLQQHGLVYPKRFIQLAIANPRYNIRPTWVYLLVLDDGLPYTEIDIYLGQRALNDCCGGILPTYPFSDSGSGGRGSGSARGPVRGPEAFIDYSQSLFDDSNTLDTGTYSYSTPITPGSSRGMPGTCTDNPGSTAPPHLGQLESFPAPPSMVRFTDTIRQDMHTHSSQSFPPPQNWVNWVAVPGPGLETTLNTDQGLDLVYPVTYPATYPGN